MISNLFGSLFEGIGIITSVLLVYSVTLFLYSKFDIWRKNKCKIKLLCRPHVYEINWLFEEDGECELKCKKCGKTKHMYIDVKSFEKFLIKSK
jgi:hypothetical protein|nr:MAG TPA: 33 kDa chaperonin [Caudoviricetes sp.]